MFVYSHKHTALIPDFIEYWKKQSVNDSDFQIALAGLSAGLLCPHEITIDASSKVIHDAWAKKDLSPKRPLNLYNFNLITIDKIYADNKIQKSNIDPFPFLNVIYGNLLITVIFKFRYILKLFGIKNTFFYIIARVLRKLSNLILGKIG